MKTRFKKGDVVTNYVHEETYGEEFMVNRNASPDKVAWPTMDPVIELIHTTQCLTLIIVESELYEHWELANERP